MYGWQSWPRRFRSLPHDLNPLKKLEEEHRLQPHAFRPFFYRSRDALGLKEPGHPVPQFLPLARRVERVVIGAPTLLFVRAAGGDFRR